MVNLVKVQWEPDSPEVVMSLDEYLAEHDDAVVEYLNGGGVTINEAFVRKMLDLSNDKVAATMSLMEAWAHFLMGDMH